ncbi:MAG: TraR/DksA C4-type zinc finger protein [Deltaproteobacteria bacterium]|nr:TraR/DksA C4-type zinc finger protein [Deltaproteobacteria bacterium]
MQKEDLFESEDFRRCADFHGHICPGLSIGYRAAKVGMDSLKEKRALDEEIVAIVENNACGTDAVQVLTGCTFGKGNFIFKDHGKQAFTFMGRNTGQGVRVALKPDALKPDDRHHELMDKIREGSATKDEQEEFQTIHLQRAKEILGKTAGDLFTIQWVNTGLPPKAKIEPSIPCDRCGEPTMASRLVPKNTQKLCKDCASEGRRS